MADEGDNENKIKAEGNVIMLVVKDQSGADIHFKVKNHTKLEKVMNAFCSKKGIDSSAVRFLFDGARLNPNSTPQELGMQDSDVIDCVMEQVGGC
eukprot:CAMPEP_0175055840 /NCGR_PEP_ID=MMETSP0052_2-20121109/10314_1 /TAXON_ID=51329 ORGANISM="Polytomella parva, Strain SAG 63-3" /NCGR_SAMPLE_ID=MMETSP0052_2 /ASSEMBLY_ACC=CAM_ASM_000194 /LENGTH=94 /DNA_ID=CAMNT_0016320751 /DNA_START=29 /DNA_END=313 /DNA_ORIENTATION=+